MQYKKFAIGLAKDAGKIMRRTFKSGIKKTWKKDGSPVTETDIAINKLVIERVKKYFPKHGVLGEEESYFPDREFLWVCDPVDGTLTFSHQIPIFAFSLALVQNGKPIAGVIYDAMAEKMYYAEKGKGATLNNKKIQVNKKPESLILCWDEWGVTLVKKYLPKANIMNLYSICYEGMLVASGQVSAACVYGGGAHDYAAVKIIVEEAGGKVTDKHGKESRYDRPVNGGLITNGSIHKKLLEIIKKIKIPN